MTKQTDMENYFMLMEISMKESGLMIRQMEKECIPMQMEQSTMETGSTINSMEREWNNGQMELSMKVNTVKEKRTVKGN